MINTGIEESSDLRIGIVESCSMYSESLSAIILHWPGLRLVHSTSSYIDMIGYCENAPIDLLILDFSVDDIDPLSFNDQLQVLQPSTCVIWSGYNLSEAVISVLIKRGAKSYFDKSKSSRIEIESSIKGVIQTGIHFNTWFTYDLLVRVFSKRYYRYYPEFSEKEQCVLDQLCQGKKREEIAEALFISTHTVKYHLQNMLFKVDRKSVLDMVVLAFQNDWHYLIRGTQLMSKFSREGSLNVQ